MSPDRERFWSSVFTVPEGKITDPPLLSFNVSLERVKNCNSLVLSLSLFGPPPAGRVTEFPPEILRVLPLTESAWLSVLSNNEDKLADFAPPPSVIVKVLPTN